MSLVETLYLRSAWKLVWLCTIWCLGANVSQEARPDIYFVVLKTTWAPTVHTILFLDTLYRVILFWDFESCSVGRRATNAPLPDQIIYFSILRLTNYRPETFRCVIHRQAPFFTFLALENWCKCWGLGPWVDALWLELRGSCLAEAGSVHVFLSTDRIFLDHLGVKRSLLVRRIRTVFQIFASFVRSSYQWSLNFVGWVKGLRSLLLSSNYLVHFIWTEMFTIGMFACFVVLRIIIVSLWTTAP